MQWPWQRTNGHTALAEAAAPAAEATIRELRTEAQQLGDTVELLQERLAELELSSEDTFFTRIDSTDGVNEFSRDFLRRITRLSRLYYLKNPLVNRAVNLQAMYVFGQGVSISATDPTVNDVVQAFLDDSANQTELTSHQARGLKEIALQIEGNLFFVMFTDKTTGRVRIRTIPFDDVADIITDPDDRKAPWYYKRHWTERRLDLETGRETQTVQTRYYPDWRYRPSTRPAAIGGNPVQWDTPVYHVRVGGLPDMRFGVPETYAALDWATAHKKFLENWATIVDSLSRFAWKMTPKGGARGVQAAKAKLGTTLGVGDQGETNPAPVTGSVAILPEGADMAPIPKTGATVNVDDSRRLLLMVCSAMGLPETFMGDASVGNHATAKTLDRPTELKFLDRRTLWADVLGDILSYVVDQSAQATRGPLKMAPQQPGDQLTLADDPTTGEPTDRSVNVDFPPILEHDVLASVQAIVTAVTLNGHPPVAITDLRLIVRLLLQALGVADIDETLDQLFPDPNADDTQGDSTVADTPPGAGAAYPGPGTDTGSVLGVEAARGARQAVVSAAALKAARAHWQKIMPEQYAGLLDATPVSGKG